MTFMLMVSNAIDAQSAFNPIRVVDALPKGLKDIMVQGKDWSFLISDNCSPLVITAKYTGSFPVPAGAILPPITITGTLTTAAVPTFMSMAMVDTQDDINTDNNVAVDMINVGKRHHHGCDIDCSHDDDYNEHRGANNHNNGNDHNNHRDANDHNNRNSSNNHRNNNDRNRGSSFSNDNLPSLPLTGGDFF